MEQQMALSGQDGIEDDNLSCTVCLELPAEEVYLW